MSKSINQFFTKYYIEHQIDLSQCLKTIQNYADKVEEKDYDFISDFDVFDHKFSESKEVLNAFLNDFELNDVLLHYCDSNEDLKNSLLFLRKYYIANVYQKFIYHIVKDEYWKSENFWKHFLTNYYDFLAQVGFIDYIQCHLENKMLRDENNMYSEKFKEIENIVCDK